MAPNVHGVRIEGDMLMELQAASRDLKGGLGLEEEDCRDRGAPMVTLDGLNRHYGKGSVHMASAGLDGNKRAWSMKQERRTPAPLLGDGKLVR